MHEVRFKGRDHHGIRAFCTCGWHADTASGQTLTELAALTEQHGVTAADFATITIPRPKPDEVAVAITDAAGASTWTFCPKTDLAEIGPLLLPHLEEGQQMVHEQRQTAQG